MTKNSLVCCGSLIYLQALNYLQVHVNTILQLGDRLHFCPELSVLHTKCSTFVQHGLVGVVETL